MNNFPACLIFSLQDWAYLVWVEAILYAVGDEQYITVMNSATV